MNTDRNDDQRRPGDEHDQQEAEDLIFGGGGAYDLGGELGDVQLTDGGETSELLLEGTGGLNGDMQFTAEDAPQPPPVTTQRTFTIDDMLNLRTKSLVIGAVGGFALTMLMFITISLIGWTTSSDEVSENPQQGNQQQTPADEGNDSDEPVNDGPQDNGPVDNPQFVIADGNGQSAQPPADVEPAPVIEPEPTILFGIQIDRELSSLVSYVSSSNNHELVGTVIGAFDTVEYKFTKDRENGYQIVFVREGKPEQSVHQIILTDKDLTVHFNAPPTDDHMSSIRPVLSGLLDQYNLTATGDWEKVTDNVLSISVQ